MSRDYRCQPAPLLWALLVALSGCSTPHTPAPDPEPARPDVPTLQIDGGTVELEVEAKPAGVSIEQIHVWVQTAGRAVSEYYRRFPVKHLLLTVSLADGGRGGHDLHGQTYGNSRIEIQMDAGVTPRDLHDDWVLTHEMFHLAFPDLRESHVWMNEGLSTYLEPIARARIGNLPVRRMWKEFVEGLPQGEPEAGDRGLDRTPTWGRIYWGGCLYWLLADIRIRQQTHGQRALDDALRSILDAGGDGASRWPVARVLEVGDRATGTKVLAELYQQMADKPVKADLDQLWRELGLRYGGGRLSFDDSAPLAWIRQALTAPPQRTPAPSLHGREVE